MGDGKKLKEILDSKNTNVRQIAKATGISATTLYSIIQKDSNIRFDFALRLANELEIDVNEICAASPFSGAITEEEIYPTLPDGLNGALDGNRVKVYLKNSLYPLMYLFGKNSMPDVDNLLTDYSIIVATRPEPTVRPPGDAHDLPWKLSSLWSECKSAPV